MSLIGLFRRTKKDDQPNVTVSDAHVSTILGGGSSVVRVPAPVSSASETSDDGFVMVNSHGHHTNNGVLPYDVNSSNILNTPQSSSGHFSSGVTDSIPFQFSPQYDSIWTKGGGSSKTDSVKLPDIDWDAFNYDFKLEHSVLGVRN